jgi:hypothetical protein
MISDVRTSGVAVFTSKVKAGSCTLDNVKTSFNQASVVSNAVVSASVNRSDGIDNINYDRDNEKEINGNSALSSNENLKSVVMEVLQS